MIRNNLYTKYFSEISSLAERLNDTLEHLPSCSDDETMEDREIKYMLEKVAQSLNSAKYAIEYFSKETIEGYLQLNGNGRFKLKDYEFSCGLPIEVYLEEDIDNGIEESWYAGRVEHTGGKGYYFYGLGKPALYEGMRVRIRK